MSVPANLKYTESHEWVSTEADGSLAIGITDHALEALGDIVFIELPVAGRTIAAGDKIAVIESVKAASDIYAPVSGEIVGANESLAGAPDRIQGNAYDAWMFKIKPDDPAATDALMTADAYKKLIGE